MFKRLRTLLGTFRSGPANKPRSDHDGVALVLVAPAYDDLTTKMSQWLRHVASELSQLSPTLLFGDEVTWPRLEKALAQQTRPRCLVFFGHGTTDSLLTAPRLSPYRTQIQGQQHGRLVDQGSIREIKVHKIVAYCCNFGRGLLDTSDTELEGLCFIDELPFHLGTDDREQAFAAPLSAAVRHLASQGQIGEDGERIVVSTYRAEVERWTYGDQARVDDDAMFVSMLLDEHLRHLRRIPRS